MMPFDTTVRSKVKGINKWRIYLIFRTRNLKKKLVVGYRLNMVKRKIKLRRKKQR